VGAWSEILDFRFNHHEVVAGFNCVLTPLSFGAHSLRLQLEEWRTKLFEAGSSAQWLTTTSTGWHPAI